MYVFVSIFLSYWNAAFLVLAVKSKLTRSERGGFGKERLEGGLERKGLKKFVLGYPPPPPLKIKHLDFTVPPAIAFLN
jgi:hypothetical protein